MTKKRKDSPSASSHIGDDIGLVGRNVAISPRRDFGTAVNAENSALFSQSSYDMYQFGQQSAYGNMIPYIPPPLCSALHFTGDPRTVEDEQEQADLFSTFVAAELSDKDTDGQSYPYAPFDAFDESDQNSGFTPSTGITNYPYLSANL